MTADPGSSTARWAARSSPRCSPRSCPPSSMAALDVATAVGAPRWAADVPRHLEPALADRRSSPATDRRSSQGCASAATTPGHRAVVVRDGPRACHRDRPRWMARRTGIVRGGGRSTLGRPARVRSSRYTRDWPVAPRSRPPRLADPWTNEPLSARVQTRRTTHRRPLLSSNISQSYPSGSETESERAAVVERAFAAFDGLRDKVAAEASPLGDRRARRPRRTRALVDPGSAHGRLRRADSTSRDTRARSTGCTPCATPTGRPSSDSLSRANLRQRMSSASPYRRPVHSTRPQRALDPAATCPESHRTHRPGPAATGRLGCVDPSARRPWPQRRLTPNPAAHHAQPPPAG